jgi:hypothetical protein
MNRSRIIALSFVIVLLLALAGVALAADTPLPDQGGISTSARDAGAGGGGPLSISGSYVAFDPSVGGDTCYDPGTSQTFCFRAESYTDDWGYVLNLWQKFSTNWEVSNVYVQGVPSCTSGGSFGAFSWAYQLIPYELKNEINISHARYHANPSDHCTAYYCFDVTTGTGSPEALESWYWSGDDFGSPPYHPCSHDGYTPEGWAACDESIYSLADIPPCSGALYFDPQYQSNAGCNADEHVRSVDLHAQGFGGAVIVDLSYQVIDGYGTCTGPASVNVPDNGSVTVDVSIYPISGWQSATTCQVYAERAGHPSDYNTADIQEIPTYLQWNDQWLTETITDALPTYWQSCAVGHDLVSFDTLGYQMGGIDPSDVVVGDLQSFNPISNTWTQLAPMPTPVYGAVASWINDKLYVSGGFINPSFDATADLQVYDPATNSWDNASYPDMPVALGGGSGGAAPCYGYVGWCHIHVGGTPINSFTASTRQTWQFNPATNAWTQLDDRPLGDTSDGILLGGGVGCNGYIFQGGDYRGYHDFYRLDPTQPFGSQWVRLANIPADAGKMSPAMVCVPSEGWSGAIYLIGGDPYGWWGNPQNPRVYRYDIYHDVWSQVLPAELNNGLLGSCGLFMANKLWTFGGTIGTYAIDPPPHESLSATYCGNDFEGWEKYINGEPYTEGMTVTVQTYDVIEVTDILHLPGVSLPVVQAQSPSQALAQVADVSGLPVTQGQHVDMAGEVIETFPNPIGDVVGLAYNYWSVRYAAESQPAPTIWDLEYPPPHNISGSFNFSVVNPGWPVSLDNRDGMDFDSDTGLYLAPDYNGDLSLRDDNLVEFDETGVILNAWELDGVGNDSYDGSSIDQVIDIASAPTPDGTRYFVTALGDGSVVYEVDLIRAGWFVDDTWGTIRTCTVPGLGDNTGIDYDEQNGYLYHSDWNSDLIVVTDLDCHVVSAFSCPSPDHMNTGVAYIEYSDPPEIWVTDWSSGKTTRCEAYPSFKLYEWWDALTPALSLLDSDASYGVVITDTGTVRWSGYITQSLDVSITKWYLTEPCTWTTTYLGEYLVLNGGLGDYREINVEKLQPDLWIDGAVASPVWGGQTANFTLSFGNNNGYENDVMVRNEFPPEALFAYAFPPPTRFDPVGTWAEWDVGDLAMDAEDSINVTVLIEPDLPISTTFEVWDGIYNHVDELMDEGSIPLHVEAPLEWDKTIDGLPWSSGMEIDSHFGDTIKVEEVLHLNPIPLSGSMPFVPVNVQGGGGNVSLTMASPTRPLGTVERQPTSPESILWDQPLSTVNQNAYVSQNFPDFAAYTSFLADDFVNTEEWQISSIYIPGDGWGGFTTLLNATALTWQIYADDGGMPDGDPAGGGNPPVWTLTLAPTDPQVVISTGTPGGYPSDTTLGLAAPLNLPPGHWWLVFYPTMEYGSYGQHGRQPSDTTNGYTAQFINPGEGFGYGPDWQDWTVIGPAQTDMAFRLNGLVVVEPPTFSQVETWDDTYLTLSDWEATGGNVTVASDHLEWTGEISTTTTITLTKWFFVEFSAGSQTDLQEVLSVDTFEVEQRPVIINIASRKLYLPMLFKMVSN